MVLGTWSLSIKGQLLVRDTQLKRVGDYQTAGIHVSSKCQARGDYSLGTDERNVWEKSARDLRKF